MSVAALEFGDAAAPGSTITVPALRQFEQAILDSDAIEVVQEMVQPRTNLGTEEKLVTLNSVIRVFGGNAELLPQMPNNITAVKFEIKFMLYANHGPSSELINAAQFVAGWTAALSDPGAMDQLLLATFPKLDLGAYKLNRQLYQEQLATSRAASAAGAAGNAVI